MSSFTLPTWSERFYGTDTVLLADEQPWSADDEMVVVLADVALPVDVPARDGRAATHVLHTVVPAAALVEVAATLILLADDAPALTGAVYGGDDLDEWCEPSVVGAEWVSLHLPVIATDADAAYGVLGHVLVAAVPEAARPTAARRLVVTLPDHGPV